MQKVVPSKKLQNESAVITVTKAVDFCGAKQAKIDDLNAQIKVLKSEIATSKESQFIAAEIKDLHPDVKTILEGEKYRLEVSAKRNVSDLASKELTASLLEDENHELLIQMASYTVTDLKKYVENWESFISTEQSGARTLKYRSM